jgi:hypothetical protein
MGRVFESRGMARKLCRGRGGECCKTCGLGAEGEVYKGALVERLKEIVREPTSLSFVSLFPQSIFCTIDIFPSPSYTVETS